MRVDQSGKENGKGGYRLCMVTMMWSIINDENSRDWCSCATQDGTGSDNMDGGSIIMMVMSAAMLQRRVQLRNGMW